MSNSTVPLSISNLDAILSATPIDEVLHGLERGEIAFLISAPDMGKGYLSLSIAYEVATSKNFVNVSSGHSPKKVLYWPIEDGKKRVAGRVKEHLESLPDEIKEDISANVAIWDCSSSLFNDSDSKSNVENLIEAANTYDLLIIDTLREAVGSLDEVSDDITVKLALQEIAKRAGVAILAIHHLTKVTARGQEAITNMSGSGFSKTQANARVILALSLEQLPKEKKLCLSHVKGNNVAYENKLKSSSLTWTADSLLVATNSPIIDVSGPDKKALLHSTAKTTKKRNQQIIEPKTVTFSDDALSPETAGKIDTGYSMVTDHDKELFAKHLSKRSQK